MLYAFVMFISCLYLICIVLTFNFSYFFLFVRNSKWQSKEKNNCSVLSNRLSVLILYFNAAKFSIKLFYFIYLTVYVVSQQDKYEIMTETRPFKNS